MTVQELLDSPEKWTQRSHARNTAGNEVPLDSADACSWCLDGAMLTCYHGPAWNKAWDRLIHAIGNPISWNDDPHRTFEDVRAVITELDL